jgi:hypothetical protein
MNSTAHRVARPVGAGHTGCLRADTLLFRGDFSVKAMVAVKKNLFRLAVR